MAQARITYGVIGKSGAQVMLPSETEIITYSSSTQSAVFDDVADIIRFQADADAYLRFGENPTATANDLLVPEGTIEYFAIRNGVRVAIYDGIS